jgi:L-ascorbate metabolism protein UlaG (beta-lactamase superfamily)
MGNGDIRTINRIKIEAVPAYNIVHKRPNGEPYHPKGRGNGYILTFGNKRVYVAGDTENIPEMKAFGKIESSLYHDSSDGCRCGQDTQTKDSVSLSLWKY